MTGHLAKRSPRSFNIDCVERRSLWKNANPPGEAYSNTNGRRLRFGRLFTMETKKTENDEGLAIGFSQGSGEDNNVLQNNFLKLAH
jgi:hypothetical protein